METQVSVDGVILPTTIKNIMDTWTLQMGYPVISVKRNYGSNTALVSQVFIFSSIILEYLHKNNFKGTILAAREERIERYA